MQCGPIRHEIGDQTTFAKHLIVHPTGFTTAEPGTDGASIQAIYGELAADQARNHLIAADIADAYRRGRCILTLTNRIEHLNQLATALNERRIEALVLHGALPKTENAAVFAANCPHLHPGRWRSWPSTRSPAKDWTPHGWTPCSSPAPSPSKAA
jgi:hypothetical protein